MRAFRSHLAVLLLLCFVRVLLPDALILALHAHKHTEQEPSRELKTAKAILTAKHQHCQTDHFCTLPFQVAPLLEFGVAAAYYQPHSIRPFVAWGKASAPAALLRGPPARA
ncbi:hypothetical protein [Hymenobacter persicinus]|uniref:Uncharacterized protein n=1 Tax=Hymenobacter persicinus TaxID=2025506 RepID=A0A4Q5LAF6_9BACT|nr:hypothetical protein [Hymenobacter persicinus]RYU78928.1 hypothetical protein EWM57_12145 [Hymenobacter persicinus]